MVAAIWREDTGKGEPYKWEKTWQNVLRLRCMRGMFRGDKGHQVPRLGRALERRTFVKVRRKNVKQEKGMARNLLMGLAVHKEEDT